MAAVKRAHSTFSMAALRLFCSSPVLPSSTEPASISIRVAKSKIKSETDPEKIVQIFQKSSESRRFHHDRAVFDISVQKLADLRRPDLIERILEPQLQNQKPNPPGSEPKSDGFVTRIMMLYSKAGMIDHAVRTFRRVEELGCVRTEKSFSALLTAFLDNKQFDKVHESFSEIPQEFGISLTVYSYNLIIRAFCEQKKLDSALSLLHEMQENGISPNVISYNSLLSGILKEDNPNISGKFDEILKEMEEKGISHDVVTYNHMILRFVKNKNSSKAKELLEEMIKSEIKPNSASYNAIINGFCSEDNLESAMEIFKGMDPPNSHAHFAIIKLLIEKGDLELGLKLCKKSLAMNWIPPFTTVLSLIDGLSKISKVDEAKEIIQIMKKKFSASAAEAWVKIERDLAMEIGIDKVL